MRFLLNSPPVNCLDGSRTVVAALEGISNFNYVKLLLCRYFDVLLHIIDLRTVMHFVIKSTMYIACEFGHILDPKTEFIAQYVVPSLPTAQR